MKKIKMRKMSTITLALIAAVSMMFSACDNKNTADNTATSQSGSTNEATGEKLSKNGIATRDDGSVNEALTAIELTKLMGNGINLGNTLEAYGHNEENSTYDASYFETLWGQPTTTQAMIDGMKAAGFDNIRIPLAWTNGMAYETGDYTISESYFNRVEEIINYALNNDMYVIINDHWDGGWWGMFGSASEETRAKAMEMYISMWTQISERYKDYSDKLIFEGANEELGDRLNDKDIAKDSGALSAAQCYEVTNQINAAFIKTVRATGGNNTQRFLLIAGYNTDITKTTADGFVIPEDTAKNKLLVSVHYYTPSGYTLEEGISNWGTAHDYEEQNGLLQLMTKFTEKGVGVIIGEYGALPVGNKIKEGTERFTSNFLDNCDYYGYVPVLWDCNGLFKRTEGKIADEAMSKLFKDRSYASQSSLSDEEEKANAKTRLDATAAAAPLTFDEGEIIVADENTAVAWIMYQSTDYSVTYSVGDVYNPGSKTTGVVTKDIIVEGEGTYTVSLDFTKTPKAKGTSFCALGIANGEKLFPGYIINIDEIKINGEVFTAENEYYTCSDDGNTTRVNLFNGWVSAVPSSARTSGDISKASAQNLMLGKNVSITTLEITFTYTPAE